MFTITKCNNNISIQDLGRPSAQHLGFSGTGAADEYSFLLANSLLKNPSTTPALEITLGQVTINITQPSTFVITGADCQATLNDKPIKNNVLHQALANSQLTLVMPQRMVYSYLAFKGGFACQYWLNSASQAKNEIALNLVSPAITLGTEFDTANIKPTTKNSAYKPPIKSQFHQNDNLVLRFIASENWLSLTQQQQQSILDTTFTISPASNRMGFRFTGEAITSQFAQQLSKPVSYGAIQLPDDGYPIVLMKDRQTIGGYPVLGNVARLDLFRLSQKRPGEQVTFLPISPQQAQAQLFAFYNQFQIQAFEHLVNDSVNAQNS